MLRAAMIFAVVGLCWSSTEAQGQNSLYARIKIDLNQYKVEPKPIVDPESDVEFPEGGEGFEVPEIGEGFGGFGCNGGGVECGGIPGQSMPGEGEYPIPQVPDEPPVWVTIHLPVKRIDVQAPWTLVHHRWGSTIVPLSDIISFQHTTLKRQYENLVQNLKKRKTRAQDLVLLAEWCLTHTRMKEFHKTMDRLKEMDVNHPAWIGYAKVHEQLQAKPRRDDPSAAALLSGSEWSRYNSVISKNGRYKLYTKLESGDPGVTYRLAVLDHTFNTFFYWFALRGKADEVLPVPDYRFIAVLEKSPTVFKNRLEYFTDEPMIDAGFTVQRDNVMFLSEIPIDPVYARIRENNQNYWQLYETNFEKVLQGKHALLDIENRAKLQTLALVQKVLEQEVQETATSHEAVRQLLAATGLMPRNVVTAEWLRFGIASFFESPRRSFYYCSGLPSWTHLIKFKYHLHTKKIPRSEAELVLYKAVADVDFNQAFAAKRTAQEQKTAALREKASEKLEVARASAWALTYYLMNNRLDDMFRFLDELKALPRDTEYSPTTLAATFARSFGISQSNPSDPTSLDVGELRQLSKSWFRYMDTRELDIGGVEMIVLQDLTRPPPKKKKKKAPTQIPYPGDGCGP